MTINYKDRAYSRKMKNQPIIFKEFHEDHVYNAIMFNYSAGGLFFKADHAPNLGSEIYIHYLGEELDQGVFDFYKGFAEVVWRRPESEDHHQSIYGVGVQCLSYECSLCKEIISLDQLAIKDNNFVYLCLGCSRKLENMPQDYIRESIEDLMIGNVI